MKKIVSAVALASVAFGAFAADLTVKSEIKYKPTIAQFNSANDISDKVYATQGSGLTNDSTVIQLVQDNVKVYGKYDFKDSGLSMNTAYGELKWGAARITAGYFESRFSNRVTTDQNDLSLIEQNHAVKYVTQTSATDYTRKEIAVAGNKKLGINPNAGMPLKIGQDSDNVTTYQGSKVNSFVVDYTFKDLGPGSLLLKGVAKTNAAAWQSSNDDGTKTTTNNSGYSLEAAYSAKDLFNADLVANLDKDNMGSWAFFFEPTMVKELKAVFGFTYAWANKATSSSAATYNTVVGDGTTISDGNYYSDWDLTTKVAKGTVLTSGTQYVYYKAASSARYDVNAWAIDARARYAINDALAAGVYANITSLTKYEKDDAKQIDGAVTALDVVANVNYKVNELAKIFVEGEYAAKSISNKDKEGDQKTAVGSKYGTTALVFQGGAILTPAKGATITAAVRCIMGGFGADSDNKYSKGTTVVIPISFKTSL